MRDIAKKAGVSVSAVSLALRNSPKVSEQRRAEITRIAEEMGYTKDGRITELMEHLRTNRTDRKFSKLAVLVPEITKAEQGSFPVICKLMEGMEAQAYESGYDLDVFYLPELKASPQRLRNILISRGIQGVIAMPWASGVGMLDLDVASFCISTAGYSIIDPMVNRACPNFLQMMDELIEQTCRLGYQRIGFAMTYRRGGIGHKLFASSFLFYTMLIEESRRIPMLPKRDINSENIEKWIKEYEPDVVIGDGMVYELLVKLGYKIPEDLGFATLDTAKGPADASGVDHRHDIVGREAFKLALADINLNSKGIPDSPKVVLVDSHYHSGATLRRVGKTLDVRLRSATHHDSHGGVTLLT
jgi:LacI family transcriptional regulator